MAQDVVQVPRQPIVVVRTQHGPESFCGVAKDKLQGAGQVLAARGGRQLTLGAVAPLDQPPRGFVRGVAHGDEVGGCSTNTITELE